MATKYMRRWSRSLTVREMQSTTTGCCHLTPMSTATTKTNWKYRVLASPWRKQTLCSAGGSWNGAAAVENSIMCLKILQGSESRSCEETFAHPCHSSIVHNSQEVESSQMPITGWLDKHNVTQAYDGVVFSMKRKELSHATTWMNLADIMVSVICQPQKEIMHDFNHYEVSKLNKLTET